MEKLMKKISSKLENFALKKKKTSIKRKKKKKQTSYYRLRENICKPHTQQKTSIYNIQRNPKLNSDKINALIRKWAKDMNRHFTEKIYR